MNKQTRLLELRWPTLATVALCMLLPGCPLTDNYFIDGSPAGAGQGEATGGASNPGAAGAFASAGSVDDAGGGALSGNATGGHLIFDGSGSTGAGGNDAGSSDAGSSDAGSDAGVPSGGVGVSGGGGGSLMTAGGGAGGTETAGAPSNLPDPACKDGVVKGSPCSAANAQLCYKSCGPDNVGYKPLTCQAGMYGEPQSGCTFPEGQDYSCYALPPSLPAECPVGMPRGGRPCDVKSCTVCFGGSIGAPQYQDSTGVQKPGYCVCSEVGSWTCGSVGSWPCTGGQSCN